MAIEYKNWKLESEIGIGIAYWELDLYIGNQNLKFELHVGNRS